MFLFYFEPLYKFKNTEIIIIKIMIVKNLHNIFYSNAELFLKNNFIFGFLKNDHIKT